MNADEFKEAFPINLNLAEKLLILVSNFTPAQFELLQSAGFCTTHQSTGSVGSLSWAFC